MKRMTEKPVMMNAGDFIKEHERLIKVLRDGKSAALNKEAMRQHAELAKMLARPGEHSQNVSTRPCKMKRQAEGYPMMHMEY